MFFNFLKLTHKIFFILFILAIYGCQKSEKFSTKDFTLLFGDSDTDINEPKNENYTAIYKDSIQNNHQKLKTKNIFFENKSKIAKDIISNILITKSYIYLIDDNYILSKYSANDLSFVSQTKINLTRIDKLKLNKFFLSFDEKSHTLIIISNFGKLITFIEDSSSQNIEKPEYSIYINDAFNSNPISDGFYTYLKSSSNSIYSLFTDNGKIAWQYNQDSLSISSNFVSSPFISSNYLILPISQFKTIILNKNNGDLVSLIENNQEADDFRIKNIKKTDLYFLDTQTKFIQSTKTNIKYQDILEEDNKLQDLQHFYTINNEAFVDTSLKNMNLEYFVKFPKILDVTPFKNGFLAINKNGALKFIDTINKNTTNLFEFDTKNTSQQNISRISSAIINDTYHAFVLNQNYLYQITDLTDITFINPFIIKKNYELNKAITENKYNKISLKNSSLIQIQNNKLYLINNGYIYNSNLQ